jgi:hypothetical protein
MNVKIYSHTLDGSHDDHWQIHGVKIAPKVRKILTAKYRVDC